VVLRAALHPHDRALDQYPGPQIDSLAQHGQQPNLPEFCEHPMVQAFEVKQGNSPSNTEQSPRLFDFPWKRNKPCWKVSCARSRMRPWSTISPLCRQQHREIILFISGGQPSPSTRQICGLRFALDIVFGENRDQTVASKAATTFDELRGFKEFILEEMAKDIAFVRDAQPVIPGEYQVLLSPIATGVFTHESFGHKSESDFMVATKP